MLLARRIQTVVRKCRIHPPCDCKFSSVTENSNFRLVLPHIRDKYDGIIMDHTELPESASEFTSRLNDSLTAWRAEKRRAIWLKIPIEKSQLIDPAVKEGFIFHHAEKDYVTMTHWLAKPEDNRIPISASHQVGVGCVVLNQKNELLLVQERSGFTKGMNLWKYPTGLLDLAEDIPVGAAREVLEETGVQTKFNSVLAFRQTHQAMFGKSDLFFICLMDLVDENSTHITYQQCELVACEWKAPEVYFNQPFIQRSGVHMKVYSIVQQIIQDREKRARNTASSSGSSGVSTIVMQPLHVGFKPGTADLYFVGQPNSTSNSSSGISSEKD